VQTNSATGNNGTDLAITDAAAPVAAAVESFPTRQLEVPQVPTPPAPPAPHEMPQAAEVEHHRDPEPVAERVVEREPVTPVVVAPAIPVAREPIVLPFDLEQVETDAEKLRIAASKVEPPPAPRLPRVRPPLPPVSNEPLVQVETRK
jgi:ribonuclease E